MSRARTGDAEREPGRSRWPGGIDVPVAARWRIVDPDRERLHPSLVVDVESEEALVFAYADRGERLVVVDATDRSDDEEVQTDDDGSNEATGDQECDRPPPDRRRVGDAVGNRDGQRHAPDMGGRVRRRPDETPGQRGSSGERDRAGECCRRDGDAYRCRTQPREVSKRRHCRERAVAESEPERPYAELSRPLAGRLQLDQTQRFVIELALGRVGDRQHGPGRGRWGGGTPHLLLTRCATGPRRAPVRSARRSACHRRSPRQPRCRGVPRRRSRDARARGRCERLAGPSRRRPASWAWPVTITNRAVAPSAAASRSCTRREGIEVVELGLVDEAGQGDVDTPEPPVVRERDREVAPALMRPPRPQPPLLAERASKTRRGRRTSRGSRGSPRRHASHPRPATEARPGTHRRTGRDTSRRTRPGTPGHRRGRAVARPARVRCIPRPRVRPEPAPRRPGTCGRTRRRCRRHSRSRAPSVAGPVEIGCRLGAWVEGGERVATIGERAATSASAVCSVVRRYRRGASHSVAGIGRKPSWSKLSSRGRRGGPKSLTARPARTSAR